MSFTFVEKVLGGKLSYPVHAGEMVVVDIDVIMATDTTAPMAIKAFHDMGGSKIAKPKNTIFVLDHAVPCPNERIANLHKLIRDFSNEQGAILYDQNAGICHQVIIENGHVKEGSIILGADSHTCSCGAVGTLALGVGSTDLGAAMFTGKTWIKVPETIRIVLNGTLSKGVFAKDVVLRIIGDLTCNGATYLAVEFDGNGFAKFSMEEAITVCNMASEMGAKLGVFIPFLTNPDYFPDKDASYKNVFNYDASDIVPMISCPHSVDNVTEACLVKGQKVDLAYIGGCTNARLSDIAVATEILRGKRISSGTRMIVCPASANVLKQAMELGYIEELINAGVTLATPGCGLCVGTLGGVPGDGEVVVSSTNRNYLGRMGNNKASIYLASPATVAASALKGEITDPREVIQ